MKKFGQEAPEPAGMPDLHDSLLALRAEKRRAPDGDEGGGSARALADFKRPCYGGAPRAPSRTPNPTSNGMAFQRTVFRCAACRVDSSGEVAFRQHINGKAHARRAKGFAGCIPNDGGIVPDFTDPALRAAQAAFMAGHAIPAGAGAAHSSAPFGNLAAQHHEPVVWRPPSRIVNISAYADRAVRSALVATMHLSRSNDMGDGQDLRPGAARGNQDEQKSRRVGRPTLQPPLPLQDGGPLARERENLPAFKHREELLDALSQPVSIVEGETGSGKTTQVAQYLLDEAARTRRPVNIICTQPRRISAIGVADRVAAERGQRVGGTVGYAVRGESRQSSETCLLFCTTGVLLRMLEEDPELSDVTHVLVSKALCGIPVWNRAVVCCSTELQRTHCALHSEARSMYRVE